MIQPKGKFDFGNVSKNLVKDESSKCHHFWIVKHTTIKRNGVGDAFKKVESKCVLCNIAKTEDNKYTDTRIIYGDRK
jgi:hypothetical protein